MSRLNSTRAAVPGWAARTDGVTATTSTKDSHTVFIMHLAFLDSRDWRRARQQPGRRGSLVSRRCTCYNGVEKSWDEVLFHGGSARDARDDLGGGRRRAGAANVS